jgi:hypothetical protein
MSNDYFVLEYPASNPMGYCKLDDLEGFEDEWAVGQGVSLADNPPEHLSMSMYAEEPRNSVLPDYVDNMDSLVVVSPRLKAFLESQQVSHVEYYPLEIIDHKGKVASDEYFVAHLVDPVDCIDTDASGAVWVNEGLATLRILGLDRLVLDPARIPDSRRLYFPKFYNKYPIVHRDLAEAMEKEGFTNVEIVPLDQCAC